MTQMLTERYRSRLHGVLSCFDRVVITGTGARVEFINRARKDDVVAKVLAQRGDHPGLVHVISG